MLVIFPMCCITFNPPYLSNFQSWDEMPAMNHDWQTAAKAKSQGSGQSCIGKPSSSGSVIAQVISSMIAGNQAISTMIASLAQTMWDWKSMYLIVGSNLLPALEAWSLPRGCDPLLGRDSCQSQSKASCLQGTGIGDVNIVLDMIHDPGSMIDQCMPIMLEMTMAKWEGVACTRISSSSIQDFL